MNSGKTKHRNYRIKNFLFFLGVAIVIWLLTNFSKEKSATITAVIAYKQVPNNRLLSDKNTQQISFDVTSNGFQLLFHSLKKPQLEIPIIEYYQEGDSIVTISESSLSDLVEKELGMKGSRNFTNGELQVLLDKTISKKIPIIPIVSLEFKEGFRPIDSIKVIPDSIRVSGPSELVNTILEWPTEVLEKIEVQQDFSERIALQNPENPKISLNPKQVEVSMNIEEFSQKQVSIPLEVVNVPKDISLKLIPESVTLSFDVMLDRFNDVSASDFRIVCDFSDRVSEGNFMIPKILNQPGQIYRVEFLPRKVEYLIFK